ncbi:nucleoside-diphosphate-sugar epimerase [Actinoplanes tereljensis]|uniref:SDR family NAD(P)-dependent oxidoreductase n=1 Tax=Paractinoplanes tereljensis TaxID=571912 RepID=A0A919NGM9_9ACTN|nr:SDR family NAD(P)-dependent oxidoreductase [Actinoplanes tereljensis]GIF18113.1 hypothetical protein Ate02nite_08430 [Actinoplanes tereljensis]
MSDLITTPFGFTSTADEILAGVDLTGRRAVVTGGATGIGRETTRALAAAGAEVTIATRNLAAAHRLAGELDGNVQAAALDLADLDSVDEPPEMFGKGVAAWAVDPDNAAHLWDVATALLKV